MAKSYITFLCPLILLLAPCALAANPPATPKPTTAPKPWATMDYGPTLSASVESALPSRTMTPKGIVIRLPATKPAYVLFDTDLLRYSCAWTGEMIDWHGVLFDGSHRTWPSVAGDQVFGSAAMPGWAKDGSFEDPRERFPSTDYAPPPPSWQRRGYGPLPRDWAQYKGLYLHGQQTILSYTVAGIPVLDSPGVESSGGDDLFTRTLNIEKASSELAVQVLEIAEKEAGIMQAEGCQMVCKKAGALGTASLAVAMVGAPSGATWEFTKAGQLRLHIPAAATPARFKILTSRVTEASIPQFAAAARLSAPPADLSQLTHGGPARWPQKLTTAAKLGTDAAAYAIDRIALPFANPWKARMRLGGFDFFKDGKRAAVCTWDGDVWLLDGLGESLDKITWQRIATGLFQPLGLKIVAGEQGREEIFVSCRDQIARLHDLNGDGEIDFYECFNNDHQVTEHFHEFALGLQTDPEGNFYYTKSARHALDAVVPQHGTLLKVSKDGSKTEIICGGFRAANGFGLGPEGQMLVSDQEGYWTPANRINLLRPGGFYGNIWSYAGKSRSVADGFDPPLCWLPVKVDRSPAEELWITSDRWGPITGKILHASYGTGKLFLVMTQIVDGVAQGGVVPIPGIAFNTGIMRARFNPGDGQLYLCGMTGWATNCTEEGGFYRVRYTGKPLCMPSELRVAKQQIAITFTQPLDKTLAEDLDSYAIHQWQYRWSERYGSANYSIANPAREGIDTVTISSAALSEDGKTLVLRLPHVEPVMQMQIELNLKAADGAPVKFLIHNTINTVTGDTQ